MAMSMNLVIHAAVRRDLARFDEALGDFPAGDRERARRLRQAWAFFEAELTRHHEGEHEIAWPALEEVGVSRRTLEEMDAEHEVMASAMAAADGAIASLQQDPSAEQASAARAAVHHLREVTVRHLDHEEREIEPAYQQHRDSKPIQDMGRRFARAQRPPAAGRFFAWVTDGAGPEERAAATHGIPRPVVAVLGLLGRGYRRDIATVWT